jgi:hypothetical protein
MTGLTINAIKIAADRQSLLFQTDKGDIVAMCDAECCSQTWAEHIEMPVNGLPAKVLNAEDIEMPDLGNMEGCDVVSYYGFKIVTDNGDILIDYRNDSNGYYGGTLAWPSDSERFYGGVFGQNVSNQEWKDVE